MEFQREKPEGNGQPGSAGRPNGEDLAYFISLQEAGAADSQYSAQKWDRRAEAWNKERANKRKGDGRVVSAVSYLEQRGLLQPSFEVADIGCGPGRFAAAFAKRVRRVVGLDLSEKMVEHGREHIRREGLANAELWVCDFQTLDIEKAGYKAAFDLVFSSMTPAVQGMNGLLKSMEMSRGWCCHITQLGGCNQLRERMMREVFGRSESFHGFGRRFYALFNILFLLGYEPETSYDHLHRETLLEPDEEYVESSLEHLLPPEEQTRENAKKIERWLQAQCNADGLVREISDASYGRVLWDVRKRSARIFDR